MVSLWSCVFLLGAVALIPHTDATPFMVVSHPFKGSAGVKAKDFEVLEWKNSSILQTGFHFSMETVYEGEIVFIHDGKVGLVAQDDGSVGVFSLAADGKPTVLAAAFRFPLCYASSVVIDPRNSSRAFVLDEDRQGSICVLGISAAGQVVDEGLWMNATGPVALLFFTSSSLSSSALLVGMDGTVVLVDLSTMTTITSVVAFPDQDALVSSAVLSLDDAFVLVLDDNTVTGNTRLGVVAIDVSSRALRAVQVIDGVADPASAVFSSFNNAALVSSSQGNALLLFSYDARNATHPFNNEGPLAPVGKAPQLPQTLVRMAGAAAVAGRVFVAELSGVRQVQCAAEGGATDLGLTSLGDTMKDVVGGMGVQPAL